MPNGYQKNGNPEQSRWRTKQDEFRGYTRAKLEEIHDDIREAKALSKKNEKDINGMKLSAALLGGFAGAVTGFLRGLF